jgi:NAD(P)-dependent dehydrogenase (short-subunit alcohol dehydrogenase family)
MTVSGKPVALVTGASRGVGRGIALGLGTAGYTVYVTGRSEHAPTGHWPGTLRGTAAEITERGGHGIAVACDHADDDQTRAVFARIAAEQGRLDILVNNAFGMTSEQAEPGVFWERPLEAWRDMIDIGLRSSYVASYYAIPLILPMGRGLVVNTSSPGARVYLHTLPYGIGKVGHDKLAHDMAHELRPHGIAAVSIWHGIVATERTSLFLQAQPHALDTFGGLEGAETPEFAGRLVAALYETPDLMSYSGGSFYAAELGRLLDVRDTNGRQPASHRSLLGAPLFEPIAR